MINKIIIILLWFTAFSFAALRPTVETNLGIVLGSNKKSYYGRTFSSFEGIPYAKPPVGELRFKKPHAAEPWTGIWNATTLHTCMQLHMNTLKGEEDCLYLNIYVPRETPNTNDHLNVFVHIHGGGFMYGNPQQYIQPTFMMDREVVFVTFTYRVGVLGFLSTEDCVVPGNNALKDQVAALKWIQNNIKNFGGNPDSVTLTGFSSGAACVQYHYLSQLSKGLFHRGIAQSGVSLNPRAFQENALQKAKTLAVSLGCEQQKSQDFIDCLRQRPAQAIVENTKLFYGYLTFPVAIFGPVIEVPTEEAFITEHPYKLLQNNIVNDLPLITSLTTEEGINPVARFNESIIKEISEKWEDVSSFLFEYNETVQPQEISKVARKLKKFYFGDEEISVFNILKLIRLFTDRHYAVGADTAVKLQVQTQKAPVYFYIFGYRSGRNSIPSSKYYGVGHGDENIYLYNALNLTRLPSEYEQMKEVFLDMYTSFAQFNKPKVPNVNWESVTDQFTYLYIRSPTTLSLEIAEEVAPIDFWKSLPINENKNFESNNK